MMPLLSIRQFFRDMRSQKLRTLLTMFGILWGTVSIVILMAFGTGLQEYQVMRFNGLGESITILWPGITSKPWQGLPRGRQIRLTEDDVALMKKSLPSIKLISPEFSAYNVMLKSRRNNMTAMVGGVWPEFSEMRNLIPQAGGRFINDKDMTEKRRTIFIGDELATKLFPGDEPVGQTLQVNGVPFVVVGVMKAKAQNSSYGGRDTRNAYVASTTFLGMYTRRYPSDVIVQSHTPDDMKQTKSDIFRYAAARYAFDPGDSEALMNWDTTEGMRFFLTFFGAFRIFLVGIGCLTLITGAIGVTNIMNVVLEERTKEIGIKMALGAKPGVIMTQFLFETFLITAIGGLIGLGIALGIISLYNTVNPIEELGKPTLHFIHALMAVGVLGLVAFLSGFFPARRASRLEPVKALKLY